MIIPPEQSAALAVGQIEERAKVVEGQIVSRPMATVVLSVDHRAINGRVGAQLLTELKEFLETRGG